MSSSDISYGDNIKVAYSAIYSGRFNRARIEQLVEALKKAVPILRKHLNIPTGINIRVAPLKKKNLEGRYLFRSNTVEISCRLSIQTAIVTLAHELVHAEQHHTGRLSSTYDNNKGWLYCWHGEAFLNKGTTYAAYRRLPWEVEAFSRQQELAEIVNKETSI